MHSGAKNGKIVQQLMWLLDCFKGNQIKNWCLFAAPLRKISNKSLLLTFEASKLHFFHILAPLQLWTFFSSKSGDFSNTRIIERFFFIFSQLFAVFDDFPKWRVPNVLQNSKKSSNIAKIGGKRRTSCNFLLLFEWLP